MQSPSAATVKRLFAVSGNRCAFPGCETPLVEPHSGEVLGQICHIQGRREGAKRHDPTLPDEQLHAFENLLLLCGVHHKVIDGPKLNYTSADLHAMKVAHERSVRPVSEPKDSVVTEMLARHVAIESELVITSRASLAIQEQQLRDQRMERAGPVLAYIADQLRTLDRWLVWSQDSSFLGAILGNQPPVRLPACSIALEQATRVSPGAYQDLLAAEERLRLFDATIVDVRDWHRQDSLPYQWKDNTEMYLSSIRNARDFLVEAREFLLSAGAKLQP